MESVPSSPIQCHAVVPSSDQIKMLQSSWLILRQNSTFAEKVYREAMASTSSIELVLLGRENGGQLVSYRLVTFMLDFAFLNLDKPDQLIPQLRTLGKRHIVYRVRREHFDIFRNVVVAVAEEILEDAFSDELYYAWETCLEFVINTMLHWGTEEEMDKIISELDHKDTCCVVKAGWLVLLEGDSRSRRWVELQGEHLHIYPINVGRFDDCNPTPQYRIKLTNCQLKDANIPFAFIITQESQDCKTLQAVGDIEKDSWWGSIVPRTRQAVESPHKVVFAGQDVPSVGMDDFEVLKLIGRGTYGKVLKVRHRNTGEVFAIKVMDKDSFVKIAKCKDLEVAAERRILQTINHPFIVRLHYAFVTGRKMCLVMDFLAGGVLLWHMNCRRKEPGFQEDHVRFYALEAALALHHLHQNGIIYRDLKPDNLILNHEGHVVLTDFGLATTRGVGVMRIGSASFMAPEIITGPSYTNSVDWWALGVLMYEMLAGRRLFKGQNPTQVFNNVIRQPIVLPECSISCQNLLSRMLCRNPLKRINGDQVLSHNFFAPIDQNLLLQLKIAPPFIPEKHGSDLKYFIPLASQQTDLFISTPCPSKPPVRTLPDEVNQLIQEFPLNARVHKLPEDTFGRPIKQSNYEDGSNTRSNEVIEYYNPAPNNKPCLIQ